MTRRQGITAACLAAVVAATCPLFWLTASHSGWFAGSTDVGALSSMPLVSRGAVGDASPLGRVLL